MQKKGPVIPSIKNSYIFSQMNKDGYIENIIKTFIEKGIILTPTMLEYEMSYINRTFKYPAKNAMLECFRNGGIIPMMLPKGMPMKMPNSIPFILNKPANEPDCKAIVFVDNYISHDRVDYDKITIDPKKLYCLMESAYHARNNPDYRSTSMISIGSSIFAHMFTRVLNKQFSLNTDKNALNKVLFLASKFFIINHLNYRDDETVFNYALKNCNSVTAILMRDIDAIFTEECFTDISTFIKALADSSYHFVSGFNKITVRDYLNSFSQMYSSTSLLALENINYFLFTISSVVLGAYMNNQIVLEDIVGKDGVKLYLER